MGESQGVGAAGHHLMLVPYYDTWAYDGIGPTGVWWPAVVVFRIYVGREGRWVVPAGDLPATDRLRTIAA